MTYISKGFPPYFTNFHALYIQVVFQKMVEDGSIYTIDGCDMYI